MDEFLQLIFFYFCSGQIKKNLQKVKNLGEATALVVKEELPLAEKVLPL